MTEIEKLQQENAELKKRFEEWRFQVGANLELINYIVHYTHRLLAEYPRDRLLNDADKNEKVRETAETQAFATFERVATLQAAYKKAEQ